MVEHSTADREVLGSTPSAPSAITFFFLLNSLVPFVSFLLYQNIEKKHNLY